MQANVGEDKVDDVCVCALIRINILNGFFILMIR